MSAAKAPKGRAPQVLVRLPKPLMRRLEYAAKAKGVGRQDVIRDVLEAVLPAGRAIADYDVPFPGFDALAATQGADDE